MSGQSIASQREFAGEREISAMFGVGIRQLRTFRMAGGGPPWRKVSGKLGQKGGRVLYNIAGVREWIGRQPGGGDSEAA
jgi:hypothetical protein